MGKYYWIFGGIAGIYSVLSEYLLFTGRLGYDRSGGVLMSKLVVLLLCIVFGSILIKKINGTISSARTMLSGALIALICSVISIAGYTFMSQNDPTFFDGAKEYSLSTWEEHNADKPDVLAKRDEQIAQIESGFGIQQYVGFTLIGYLVSGLLVSLFTAAFLSNKNAFANTPQ